MKYFVSSLLSSVKDSFSYYYGVPHVVAIVLTVLLVSSGFDWWYFTFVKTFYGISYFFLPAIIIGGILPIVLPIIMITIGYIMSKVTVIKTGWMLAQAMIVSSFICTLYKMFAGRDMPSIHTMIINTSDTFHLGFFEGDLVWGWPASHATIAFAMAMVIVHMFPTNKRVHLFSMLYALYISLGVTFSVHWFSDVVAGAILGAVIGIVVSSKWKSNSHNITLNT